MKLRNIYYLCKKYKKVIEVNDLVFSNYMYSFAEEQGYKEALEKLGQIECLQKSIEDHMQAIEKVLGDDAAVQNSNLEKKFYETRRALFDKINTIISLYESMDRPKEELPGIDIKLPDTSNFSDFKKIIDEIDFIITKCPFLQSEKESLQFAGIDVGSQWLSFVISGMAIVVSGSMLLNNILAFVDKCIVIRSHYLTTESQKQEVEKSKTDQNEKAELIKNINKIYKIQVDNVIKELEEETGYTISDGDEKGRTEQALQKAAELIDKGLEIVASIDTKQEIKVLFEPLEMKYLSIENKLKVIEDKKKKENKNED